MHIHIVHAHPEPHSYNGALTETACNVLQTNAHTVTVSDLYRLDFDPVERASHYAERADETKFTPLNEQRNAYGSGALPPDVKDQIERLERSDVIILQFPLWWHGPPAILKGWFDRVFVNGGIYTSTMRYDRGYFQGKKAVLSVTTGAPRNAFGPNCRGGDFQTMLWPLHYSLHYLGFSVLPPFISYGIQGHGYSYEDEGSLSKRLSENLVSWGHFLEDLPDARPIKFPTWKDWDDAGQAI